MGKIAQREMSSVDLVLLRFIAAAIVAAPFALRRAESRALSKSTPIVLGGAFNGVAFVVQCEGLAGTSVSLAALIVGAMPALSAVSARLLGEKVSQAS